MKNLLITAFFLFVTFFTLSSNAQESTRIDIEQKLYGRWTGEIKSYNGKHVKKYKQQASFEKNMLQIYSQDGERNYQYRIFIHKNKDTILQRTEKSSIGTKIEPWYGRVHFINKNEVKIIFLLKMSERQFVDDKKSGYYLKRTR